MHGTHTVVELLVESGFGWTVTDPATGYTEWLSPSGWLHHCDTLGEPLAPLSGIEVGGHPARVEISARRHGANTLWNANAAIAAVKRQDALARWDNTPLVDTLA